LKTFFMILSPLWAQRGLNFIEDPPILAQ